MAFLGLAGWGAQHPVAGSSSSVPHHFWSLLYMVDNGRVLPHKLRFFKVSYESIFKIKSFKSNKNLLRTERSTESGQWSDPGPSMGSEVNPGLQPFRAL